MKSFVLLPSFSSAVSSEQTADSFLSPEFRGHLSCSTNGPVPSLLPTTSQANPRQGSSHEPVLPQDGLRPPPFSLLRVPPQSPTTGLRQLALRLVGACSVRRIGEVKRVTEETNVSVKINLDGMGIAASTTGIPFLDHMLDQITSHRLFDVLARATGDLHIDDHRTNEDVALAIGTALGDRKGIHRFGYFSAPPDEELMHFALDLSGRPHLSFDLQLPTQQVGTYDTQPAEHFFQSLVNTSGMTLHIKQLTGTNTHRIIEATFKASARALRQATECNTRREGAIPSYRYQLKKEHCPALDEVDACPPHEAGTVIFN